jgi:hypothetical protein
VLGRGSVDASDIIEIHQLLGLYGHRVCTGRWQFTPGEQQELPEHRRTW